MGRPPLLRRLLALPAISRSALGLDASTFNASACHRRRCGCAAASASLMWLAGFAGGRGEVTGVLCYSVVKELSRLPAECGNGRELFLLTTPPQHTSLKTKHPPEIFLRMLQTAACICGSPAPIRRIFLPSPPCRISSFRRDNAQAAPPPTVSMRSA